MTKAHLANELVATMKAHLSECNDRDIISHIIYSVCRALQISEKDLKSENRTTELTEARFILFFILVKHQCLSTVASGKLVNRDHSTVLNGLKRYQAFVDSNDRSFLDKVHKVMEELAV